MQDDNSKVKFAAIKSAMELKEDVLVPQMIENLKYAKYSNASIQALSQMGDVAVIGLGRAFKKTGQSTELMIKILNVLGEIASEKSIALLVEKLGHADKNIVNETMKTLRMCKYTVDETFFDKIIASIEQNVSNTSWLLAALDEIGAYEFSDELKFSVGNIIEKNNDLLYSLLSLIYDDQSIALVRENIEKGTADSIGYAIELLDVFMAEELKQFIFPILDDISLEDKLQKLQVLFPREVLSETEVLIALINKDYNQIDRWTKACSMRCLASVGTEKVSNDIIAQMFNKDKMLRETAAWFVFNNDKTHFETVLERIDKDVKDEWNNTFSSDFSLRLKFDKVLFLKQMLLFKDIPELMIKELVDDMSSQVLKKGETVIEKENMSTLR